MTNENASKYFERAVTVGDRYNYWVLASKSYLAAIRREAGRRQDAMDILRELATLDLYEIKEPNYIGPFSRINDPIITLAERIDDARAEAAGLRDSARRHLVSWSVVPGDPGASLENLRRLIRDFAGTPIADKAKEEEARVLDDLRRSIEESGAEMLLK